MRLPGSGGLFTSSLGVAKNTMESRSADNVSPTLSASTSPATAINVRRR
jgi:hypothetical protein